MILVIFTKLLFSRYFPLIRGYYSSICWTPLLILNLSNYRAMSHSAHISQKSQMVLKIFDCRYSLTLPKCNLKKKKKKKLPYINFTNNSFSYGEKCELKWMCRYIYTQAFALISLYISYCIVIVLHTQLLMNFKVLFFNICLLH